MSTIDARADLLVSSGVHGAAADGLTLVAPIATSPAEDWQPAYLRALITLDVVVALTAAIAAAVLVAQPQSVGLWALILGLPVAWVTSLALSRAYERRVLGVGRDEFRRVLRAGVTLVACGAFAAYATDLNIARAFVLVALPATVCADLAGRYVLRGVLHRRRAAGKCTKRIILVGDDRAVLSMVRELRRSPRHGLEPVAACLSYGSDAASVRAAGLQTFRGMETALHAVEATNSDVVAVLTGPVMAGAALRKLSWEMEGSRADLMLSTGLEEVAGPRLHITQVDGLPLLHLAQPRFTGASRVVKSFFERTLAFFALVVLAPLLIGIAMAVKITSPGPVIYRQPRCGRDGRLFPMLKFRSMVVDADKQREDLSSENELDGPLFKMRQDPRVTPVGRILRRWSLDELPQLISVLRGDMSLVGPRPPLPDEVARYEDHVHRRLLVKPGLTGLWQVSGRSDLSWEDSVRLDLHYVDNWSVALDVAILWHTARAVVRGTGAY